VPAREFNLKAYATNDLASLGLEPRLADHRSQAARTATLPIATPGQAFIIHHSFTLSLKAQNLPFNKSFPP